MTRLLIASLLFVSVGFGQQTYTPNFRFPLRNPHEILPAGSKTDTTSNTGLNGITLKADTWLGHYFGRGTDTLRNINKFRVGSVTWRLPTADGTSGQALTTNGSGLLSFGSVLPSLTNHHIFVGNGSSVATDVAMSGDATIINTGALTIANDAVSYAKMQNVSTNNRLLGRATSGAGDVEEITVGTGLSITGTTLNAAHTILSASHTDALAGTVVRGDMIYGNSTPAWARLAKGTTSQIMMMNSGATEPAWTSLLFNCDLDGLDATLLDARIYFLIRTGSGVGIGFTRKDAQTVRLSIQDAGLNIRGLIQATGNQTLTPNFTFQGNNTTSGISDLSGGAHLLMSSVSTGSQTIGTYQNFMEFTTSTNLTVTLASAANSVGVPQTIMNKLSTLGTRRMFINGTVSGDASIVLAKSGDYLSITTSGAVNGWRVYGGMSHGEPIHPVDNGYIAQTTDNTQTHIDTILLDDNTTTILTATVGAHRTGGGSGTAQDGASYKFVATWKVISNVAAIIGSIASLVSSEDQAGWDATFTSSGQSVFVSVTGAAGNNIDWDCWVDIKKVK
jgi:hypothetical protein